MSKPVLSRTVRLLAAVSLLADLASEMLYPVMPVFLKSIGFSVLLIGLLEGVAEAVAGLSKGYFGRLSDQRGQRLPFVRWGYFASAVSKPMLAFFAWPLWIFAARTLDRLGKGLRTGARDAMLSDEATPGTKGRVFGFHRSMDTVGAVLGPLAALGWLHFFPGDYKSLFIMALGPGLLAVGCTFWLREKEKIGPRKTPGDFSAQIFADANPQKGFFSFLDYWKQSPPAYRRLATGLLLFALFNSSDAFLLLKMKSAGATDGQVIGAYVFYNLVFALAAWPLGVLADRVGLKKVFLAGLALFALTYLGFAGNSGGLPVFYALFFMYGLYAAATDGLAKAWISNISEKKDTATAIGTFAGLQSLAALAASVAAGAMWQFIGPEAPFLAGAAAACLAVVFLWRK